MAWFKTGVAAVIALALAAGGAVARGPQPGRFDYFVLSLSWSPSYCADKGQDDAQQCGPNRHFAFVVHGLWPQFQQGWPENCQTREGWVAQKTIDGMMDLMPSRKLIIHEWKRHGTCSGVSQADYFRAIRLLREKVKVPARYLSPQQDVVTTPEQLKKDFMGTNLGLRADMMSVQCGNARDTTRLSDLRICLDRQGAFTACGGNEARACRARTLIMPRVK